MKSYKIFSYGYSNDYYALTIILVFCSISFTKDKISLFSTIKTTSDVRTIIYKHTDKETCLDLSAYRYPALDNSFEKLKGQKENGIFYYFDDENEVVIVQKKLSNKETEVSVKFWKQKNEINIVLLSCPDFIKENKKALNALTESLQ